jgi:hypothetical protein
MGQQEMHTEFWYAEERIISNWILGIYTIMGDGWNWLRIVSNGELLVLAALHLP